MNMKEMMKKNYLKPEVFSEGMNVAEYLCFGKSGTVGAKDGAQDFSSNGDEIPSATTWSEDDD